MQTRSSSLIEACLNTFSGFVLAFVVWHFVALWFGIPMSFDTNLKITSIFTIVSIVRSYLWRRIFNKREKTLKLADIDFVRDQLEIEALVNKPIIDAAMRATFTEVCMAPGRCGCSACNPLPPDTDWGERKCVKCPRSGIEMNDCPNCTFLHLKA